MFGITPLFIAVQNQRADIVEKLIAKGVDVIEPDAEGVTPLALSCSLGNIAIMESLLSARADTDDGSLHDAARQLRTEVIRTLIKHDHMVNCPSARHDGRTALAELCLNAVSTAGGQAPPTQAKIREALDCLIYHGADIRKKDHLGKGIFHHALDSEDPLLILPVMLKIMWPYINEDAFLFSDKTYTYSLTMYIEKGLSTIPPDQKDDILHLLRIQEVKDRYWATFITAEQPPDYCNGPPDIQAERDKQMIWEKEQVRIREQIQIQLENEKAMALGLIKIKEEQTSAEIGMTRRKGDVEIEVMTKREKQQLALEMNKEGERDRVLANRQHRELAHQKETSAIIISTQARLREEDAMRNAKQLEYTQRRINVENEGTRNRLAIENSGMAEQDRYGKAGHEREMAKLRLRGTVVDKQVMLAGTLANAGANQRTIGYIAGEMD